MLWWELEKKALIDPKSWLVTQKIIHAYHLVSYLLKINAKNSHLVSDFSLLQGWSDSYNQTKFAQADSLIALSNISIRNLLTFSPYSENYDAVLGTYSDMNWWFRSIPQSTWISNFHIWWHLVSAKSIIQERQV